MSLGLKRAGFEVVAAYDSWQAAVDVYRQNLGGFVRVADLKDIFRIAPEIVAQRPDMIVGGPPCQDFSTAGERIEGERAGLTRAFAMLVCIVRPRWFLMENVPLAARSDAWRDARAMLVKAGYGLTETTLNATYYGVPQTRKRLFVVGRLGEADAFLESALAAARSPEKMPMRAMFGEALGGCYYAHPRHPGKRGVWSVDEPAPTMRGSSRRPMPATYQPRPGDTALVEAGAFFTRPYHDGRGVRSLDEPAPAVVRTTRERPRQSHLDRPHPADSVHPAKAAVLTQEQVSRIQGFPIGWDWSGAAVRDVDQMIANAVPAPLAEAIGRTILAREAGESIPEIQGRFGQWLRRSKGFNGQAVRNGKSRVNRARRLLGGRTFPDLAGELAALDAVEAFAALPTGTRSDLRKALRLYREWQEQPKGRRKVKAVLPAAVEAVAA
ncbi:MAG: DNA cytosine methyltransferase [Rhizobiales bacterium]|nr:DNA cytosine methyltransferase [Hyphomicrobiales bacterium]